MQSIPLSGEEFIIEEINGIRYKLRPAIGRIESRIKSIQEDTFQFKKFTAKAEKLVKAEHPELSGKELFSAIFAKGQELAENDFWDNYSEEKEIQRRDEIFNLICAGWEGDCYQLKDKDIPSDHLKLEVKEHLVSKYLKDNFSLSDEQIKN